MSENSEKIERAIASFNNQITRISKIANTFSVGNKVRVHLESEIKKLVEDRDTLKDTLSHTADSVLKAQAKTEEVGIKENIRIVLGRADKIEESPDSEMLRILRKLDKNSITKKMTFFISLSAGAVMFVIGVIVGYFLP